MSLIAELKRRKVIKVGAAYLVVGWLAVQAASIAFPTFDAPLWALRVFILIALLGFPVAVVMAWIFDVTPEGLKVEPAPLGNKRMFAITASLMALALAWYFVGQPSFRHGQDDARSIAVLPFVNMSADPAQEFFSDGIAEELLNRLAQFPDLKVAARTSAFQFKGKNVDVADIGRQLKVSHVLEGSVRKQGARLRITAQLIDTTSGYHLWSETYERDAADVFQVQDEISTAIAEALEAKLSGRKTAGSTVKTVNPAAYNDYLQGRAFLARRVGDNLKQAAEAFDRAIAKDPSYSPAHSGRAFAIAISAYWGPWQSLDQVYAQGLASADEALRLDPGNAEAYMVRGTIESQQLRITAARADMERAYALARGSVDVINFYGDFLRLTGDLRRAERMKRQAMALDPLAFVHPLNLSSILAAQGRYAEALMLAERSVALGAGGYGREQVIRAQLRLGRGNEAQATLAKLCQDFGTNSGSCLMNTVAVLASSGRAADTRPLLAKLETATPTGGGSSGYSWLAAMYAIDLHDYRKAAGALRASREVSDWAPDWPLNSAAGGAKLPEEMSQDPDWLAAWNDPRVKELMDAYRANLMAFRKGG